MQLSEDVRNALTSGHLAHLVTLEPWPRTERPEALDLDSPLGPVQYPPDTRTVSELAERAFHLAGLDAADVLRPGWTDD